MCNNMRQHGGKNEIQEQVSIANGLLHRGEVMSYQNKLTKFISIEHMRLSQAA